MKEHFTITLEDERSFPFEIDYDRQRSEPSALPEDAAEWTALEFGQCEHCPLTSSDTTRCPAAQELQPIVALFSEVISYEKVTISYFRASDNLLIKKEVDAQTAISELMSALILSSSCPYFAKFRKLREFFVPFPGPGQFAFRILAWELVNRFFKDESLDAQHLDAAVEKELEDLSTAVEALFERIRGAAEQDASRNALMHLLNRIRMLLWGKEEMIEELRGKLGV